MCVPSAATVQKSEVFLLWLRSELGIDSISQLVFFHKNRIVIKWRRFQKFLWKITASAEL